MRRQITLVTFSAGLLAGCATIADSPVNPLNWFGSSPAPVAATGEPLVPAGALVAPMDRRVAVTVTGVEVARTDEGAVVRAAGVAPGAGYYNAQLVRVGIDNGIMVLRLVAEAPATPVAGDRTLNAATAVTAATLAGLRGVRVEGATGAVSAGL